MYKSVEINTKKETILFKDYLIVPDRLYPTFTGWYCHIFDKTDIELLHLINHSNWIKGHEVYNKTKEQIINFVKRKLSEQ